MTKGTSLWKQMKLILYSWFSWQGLTLRGKLAWINLLGLVYTWKLNHMQKDSVQNREKKLLVEPTFQVLINIKQS